MIEGEYAESTMKFVFMSTDEADEHGIHEVEDAAEALTSATALAANGAATTLTNGELYEATVNANSWISVFNIEFPSVGYYAFFAEHDVAEFSAELKDDHGEDVEPEYIEGQAHEESYDAKDEAGNIIAACVVVWSCTLAGLCLVVLPRAKEQNAAECCICGFHRDRR